MRLISCHIDNFGKWSNKDLNFENGINELFMSNGEGKTTLAFFIKAMFYGLKGYTEKTKDFVERKHFFPFGKGTFGGNIRFEHNGSGKTKSPLSIPALIIELPLARSQKYSPLPMQSVGIGNISSCCSSA